MIIFRGGDAPPLAFAGGLCFDGRMTVFPYQDRTFVRFVSDRTGETMFELKMLAGAVIVWGSRYRPDELSTDVDLEAGTITVTGVLRDSAGPVVTFAAAVVVSAPYRVEMGALPADYDATWRKDES